jgi:hypothetical protein
MAPFPVLYNGNTRDHPKQVQETLAQTWPNRVTPDSCGEGQEYGPSLPGIAVPVAAGEGKG